MFDCFVLLLSMTTTIIIISSSGLPKTTSSITNIAAIMEVVMSEECSGDDRVSESEIVSLGVLIV